MAPLPDVGPSPTVAAIYLSYESKPARHREHLGASIVGKDCCRELWYSFRWCAPPAFPGRVLRLFQSGFREEPRVLANLRAIGCTVHETDPETGKQFRYSRHGGHFGGSMDGVVLGIPEAPKTWHLLEVKTHNAKSFRQLELHGVEKSKPVHATQMQVYMGLAGLKRGLYFAVCKDNDALYTERLRANSGAFQAAVDKARRVIAAVEPLTRIADSAEAFACKFCDYKHLCHEGKVPPVSCRTCAHATPVLEGGWTCALEHGMGFEQQLQGCLEHLYIPALVPYAAPVDSGDGWVAYQVAGEERYFINTAAGAFPGIDQPCYGSAELARVDAAAVGDPALERMRESLEGRVIKDDDATGAYSAKEVAAEVAKVRADG